MALRLMLAGLIAASLGGTAAAGAPKHPKRHHATAAAVRAWCMPRSRLRLAPLGLGSAPRGWRPLRRACGAAGVAVNELAKLQEGRPNLIDLIQNHEVALVINTPSGKGARTDEGKIRAAAVANGVTCITTLAAAQAAVEACRALREQVLTVTPLQRRFV